MLSWNGQGKVYHFYHLSEEATDLGMSGLKNRLILSVTSDIVNVNGCKLVTHFDMYFAISVK
jgi:hypothetical protein